MAMMRLSFGWEVGGCLPVQKEIGDKSSSDINYFLLTFYHLVHQYILHYATLWLAALCCYQSQKLFLSQSLE